MKNFVNNLRWRGMIHDMVPGMEAHQEKTIGYIGFDPSAPSLHLGNLVTIMLLKYFQEAGHTPIALLGGATGMIGDPSGRTKERLFLTEEVLRYNESCIAKQLQNFLDFSSGSNRAKLLNNFHWFKDTSLLSFLREVGKHISIGYMMAKESVKQRIDTGISYTEFAYQLLQGYDFYHLYLHEGVKLQMGGADQWGNLTTGVELIRKKTQSQVFALTIPLLTRRDGTKFGKTASGENIWLDPEKTSPYKFYQFLLNCSDDESQKLIKIFHNCEQEALETLIVAHTAKPEQRLLQQILAEIVTTMVHSRDACKKAILCSNILFGNAASRDQLLELGEDDLLTVCGEIPKIHITRAAFEAVDSMLSLLSVATKNMIMDSKAEVKRMIASRGIMVNKLLVTDPFEQPSISLLHNRYVLVQKGKKSHYLIVVQ